MSLIHIVLNKLNIGSWSSLLSLHPPLQTCSIKISGEHGHYSFPSYTTATQGVSIHRPHTCTQTACALCHQQPFVLGSIKDTTPADNCLPFLSLVMTMKQYFTTWMLSKSTEEFSFSCITQFGLDKCFPNDCTKFLLFCQKYHKNNLSYSTPIKGYMMSIYITDDVNN